MSKESQPKPTEPEHTHVVNRITGKNTIVGVTTLLLASEDDPKHIASFLEVVGVPETVNLSRQPWEQRRARFAVSMIRYSLGDPDPKNNTELITKREPLYRDEKLKNAYTALDDAKDYAEKKLAQRAQKAQEIAALEALYADPKEDK